MLAYYILREMNLREKHAEQIREREEWFRITLTSIGDAVVVTDEAGKVKFSQSRGGNAHGTGHAPGEGSRHHRSVPDFQ